MPQTVCIRNPAKKTVLARRCAIASTHLARMVGLLTRSSLAEGDGLLIERCAAIHMIGMRFAIDVVFLDDARRVLKTAENVRPWTLAVACAGADCVLELPVGVIAASRTEPGDKVEFTPAS